MEKKNNIGLKILVWFLTILLAATVGYIVGDKFIFNNKTEGNTANEIVNKNGDTTEKEENTTTLKEGYIIFDDYNEEKYKIYGITMYSGYDYAVVGYKNNLYVVEQDILCISKINSVNFDSLNTFEGKFNEGEVNEYSCRIKKFDGKESDLLKVTSSIWHSSTDGSKYPILIYKDGRVETINNDTAEVLKDYKIKDFVSEKCKKFNNMKCEKGQLEYKVVLQDGTMKTITK